ncbi:MAG TPA: hypothetical protein VGS27_10385 [Candidatus Sulfotelmatobacter sp.]|nr:hypothetical protein [Candidatus Sulfotelmatobacter sp.]
MRTWATILALVVVILPSVVAAQRVTSFEGIDASQLAVPNFEIDHNGAVGTKQYLEWVNFYYQAYDKTTHTAIWANPQTGDTPWQDAGISNCYGSGGGEGVVTFDRLASRWVIAKRASPATNQYYYCIAVSNTDDLSSKSLAWYTYQFNISSALGVNSAGNVYYPDYPKFGTWSDGYYASFDLEDPNNQYQEIGAVVCAFDRSNMIVNKTARTQQCFSNPNPIPLNGALYLSHSLIPADIDGTTAPPTGQHEYLVSIQNPPADGKTTTSTKINLWNFHVNWTTPSKSTFVKSTISVASYEPGCYDVSNPVDTFCVTEPSSSSTGNYVDSIGDRLMYRLAYRNFGTYQSFLVSHAIQVGAGTNQQTGVRWYELRGSGTPKFYQSGTVTNGNSLYRFTPSIAQDNVGNAAVGYSVSSSGVHPGIRAAYWSLPSKTAATEIQLKAGVGDEENSNHWGNLTSMTVDPVDNCTFWYVNQYYANNETGTAINWNTRIAYFKLSSCH